MVVVVVEAEVVVEPEVMVDAEAVVVLEAVVEAAVEAEAVAMARDRGRGSRHSASPPDGGETTRLHVPAREAQRSALEPTPTPCPA